MPLRAAECHASAGIRVLTGLLDAQLGKQRTAWLGRSVIIFGCKLGGDEAHQPRGQDGCAEATLSPRREDGDGPFSGLGKDTCMDCGFAVPADTLL